MSLTKLLTDAAATKALVGRQIVRVETRAFREAGQTYTNPVLILDNGARISFQGHTPDSGDAVTLLLIVPKKQTPKKPEKVASDGPLATFRRHMKTLDKYATVTRSIEGFVVRTDRFWKDGRRFGSSKPAETNEALQAFLPGCPTINDVQHIDIEAGRNGRHIWYVTLSENPEKEALQPPAAGALVESRTVTFDG